MSIQPTSNSEGSSTVQVSIYLEEGDFPKYFLVKYLCPLAKQDAPLNGVSVPGWKGECSPWACPLQCMRRFLGFRNLGRRAPLGSLLSCKVWYGASPRRTKNLTWKKKSLSLPRNTSQYIYLTSREPRHFRNYTGWILLFKLSGTHPSLLGQNWICQMYFKKKISKL